MPSPARSWTRWLAVSAAIAAADLATKAWVTHGGQADFYNLMVRTGGEGAKGISCLLADDDTPGLNPQVPERKMGMKSSPTATIQLDGARIPGDRLIGDEGQGFRIAMSALDGGRLGSVESLAALGGPVDGNLRRNLDALASRDLLTLDEGQLNDLRGEKNLVLVPLMRQRRIADAGKARPELLCDRGRDLLARDELGARLGVALRVHELACVLEQGLGGGRIALRVSGARDTRDRGIGQGPVRQAQREWYVDYVLASRQG